MRTQIRRWQDKVIGLCVVLGLSLALGAGCAASGQGAAGGGDDPGIAPGGGDGKSDAWDYRNDPRRFGQRFEYSFAKLSTPELMRGAAQNVPWPDTYWPMKEDGYNQRWQGADVFSPVEKYDQVFNRWDPPAGFAEMKPFSYPGTDFSKDYYQALGPAATWAHVEGGNYQVMNGVDDDDNQKVDDDWDGMEGWWGHCHAWAPAAMMEPEPQHAVEVNGVRFEVSDIKALAMAMYEQSDSVFLGGRCNVKEVKRDDHGRIIEDECRDTNAGSFHVVTVNVLGLLKRSFVIDATYDYQVWNQPVRRYEITQQEKVSLADALKLLKLPEGPSYPYNPDARDFVHVKMNFDYIVEGSASREPYLARIDDYTRTQHYEYLLELGANGNIIGGEWIVASPHPDFMWAPTGHSDVWHGPGIVIAYSQVRSLIEKATRPETPPPGGDEQVFEAAPAAAIPDNSDVGVDSTLTVPGPLLAGGVKVRVKITHTFPNDLSIELRRGGETVAKLYSGGEGGVASAENIQETFDVPALIAQDVGGEWTLHVVDSAEIDVGTLDSWAMVVTRPRQ